MERRKKIIDLILSLVGVFIILFGVVCFNKYFFMKFSLKVRMILGIVLQWAPFLVPAIYIYKKNICIKIKPDNWFKEIIVGVIIALIMSTILTVFPIILGFRELIGHTTYSKPWQFIYEFIYSIIGVAFAEELIFRGYIFNHLLSINKNKWYAIILSSVMFGFYHIFNLNLVQVVVTTILGIIYCICSEKISNCTIVSLIVAHGIYDGLIVLWLAML